MTTSSPVGSGASAKTHGLPESKRQSTGSYGCVREVLHPLDPRAEPSALLYYDSSSDDEFDEEFLRRRGLFGKPTKRRLSFNTDSQTKKTAAVMYEPSRYSPENVSREPGLQALKELLPLNTPSPRGQSGSNGALEDTFLERFSAGIGLSSSLDEGDGFLTSQNPSVKSLRSQLRNFRNLTPITLDRLPGAAPPENTTDENLDCHALSHEIKRCLQELQSNEGESVHEVLYRLEALISGLCGCAGSDDNQENKIQYILEGLTSLGMMRREAAQKLLVICQKPKMRMSPMAIISRWLVHDRLYESHIEDTSSHKLQDCVASSNNSEWRYGVSPSLQFAFRSSKQQDFSPSQTHSIKASQSRSPRRKSDMAESIETLKRKLYSLQSKSELVSRARKVNATREHEVSMKHYYNKATGACSKVKMEATLDTQLHRLLQERRTQEEAIRQVEIWAKEEARKEEARRQEVERVQQAAAAAARQRAVEEAERRKQEEEAVKKRTQEEIEKRAREEAVTKAQAEEDYRKRHELELQLKRQEAEKDKLIVQTVTPQDQKQMGAPLLGEYGRKSVEPEKVEMKKLLAALKDVRKKVNGNRDLFKNVNAKKRAMNPKLGQLNGEVAQTNAVRNFIITTLSEMKEGGGPMVEAAIFQLNRDPRVEPKPPAQVPLVFIWMINELGKMVVRQVEAESAVSIKTANPIGVAVVSALAREGLLANNKSFIDVIVARLWKKCPILQGVLGPEDTVGQMQALGWKKLGDQWEGDEAHVNRMVGYVAGFSAIAGRNFMNSQALNNPYPPFNLWFILAYMSNNADKLTNTHFFCIKTILEVAGDTLRKVYGKEAEKLINIIFQQLATYGANKKYAGGLGLQALRAKFEKDHKFL